MASRDFERAPGRLQVEFRSPTALLVAYSVNLSRGGMFIQCGTDLPPEGAELDLEITLPDRGIVSLQGIVTWRREESDDSGPRGVGIQFDSLSEDLGGIIDELVGEYSSISILVQCLDPRDRKTLLRMVKSIIGTAEIVFASNHQETFSLLRPSTDLLIVDGDEGEEAACASIKLAQGMTIPTIALASSDEAKAAIKESGTGEILRNPPSAAALRKTILQLLSTPTSVRTPPPD